MAVKAPPTTRRKRAVKLRVVSHTLTDRPRHRVTWVCGATCEAVEVWLESEWNEMLDHERPDESEVWHIPTVGYVRLSTVTAEESKEIAEDARLAIRNWHERKELGR